MGSSQAAPVQPVSDASVRAIVLALAGAGVVVTIMGTVIVPLIPTLPALLHASSAADASWAITATLLAGAVSMPVAGRLGDLHGKRRVLIACTWVMVAGSLLCALSSTLAPVTAGRALQGVGLAAVPLGISIMRDVLPPARLPGAIALMSSSFGVGGALGLPISALVAQAADWHALFWLCAGAGTAFAVLVRVVVPESPVRASGRFDIVGALGLTTGLLALLLAITKGSSWGWGSATTLSLVGTAVVVLVLWGLFETRVTAPLVDLRASARRPVLLTNLCALVVGFAMYAISLVAPQVLQLPGVTGYGLGQSMLAAGLWMAPGGLAMMAIAPLTARLTAARGPKVTLLVGTAVLATAYLGGLGLLGSPAGVMAFTLVNNCGVAFAYAAMPALIMSAVPPAHSASANTLNSLSRSIGMSTASAVVAVILSHLTVPLGAATAPSLTGIRVCLILGAVVSAVAGLIALTLPAGGGRRSTPSPATTTASTGPIGPAGPPTDADDPSPAAATA
ncbi:MFS transporter [Parafrankia sp. EUN1f]|uniref:MFS transporter n=1 Tax=Parafrankia sp. EUN1f TaxID=102897 RepID=UPI0001C43910|nr:MFS transporter [Parafrankia sp. EUN1f]EFC86244.1 major facilitator superfamily MFS_1 [Parafrankia sp. EUN1f]